MTEEIRHTSNPTNNAKVAIIGNMVTNVAAKAGADISLIAGVALLLFYGREELMAQGLLDDAIIHTLSSMITITLAIILLRVLSMLLNRMVGFSVRKWLAEAPDMCKAVYISSQYVGLCVLIGMVLFGGR